MTNLKITAAQETDINMYEDAWLVVDKGAILFVGEGKATAQMEKKVEELPGKLVQASKCEFEIIADSDLPDETISEEDEAEVAAALDAEEAPSIDDDNYSENDNPTVGGFRPALPRKGKPNEAIKTSLKLNRAVVCVETDQTWDKVGDIHKLNPELMTWSQCGRIRKLMYAAAKNGEQLVAKVGEYSYKLTGV